MKKILQLLLLVITATCSTEEKSIVLVIPSYNNASWYERNLESVLTQNYTNYRAIYIDDASTDGTGTFVKEYLAAHDPEHKVTFIQNATRAGAMQNIFDAVWMCSPYDLIATLDGDDWLSKNDVLAILNDIYSNPDVWMTYGQYRYYPTGNRGGCEKVPEHIVQNNAFRSYDWVSSHLRTFYAGLFHKIDKADLLEEGKFFSVTWDLAFMFPLLEMAGNHSCFIEEILYIYNIETPLSDNKLRRDLIHHFENIIRNKEKYTPLQNLF